MNQYIYISWISTPTIISKFNNSITLGFGLASPIVGIRIKEKGGLVGKGTVKDQAKDQKDGNCGPLQPQSGSLVVAGKLCLGWWWLKRCVRRDDDVTSEGRGNAGGGPTSSSFVYTTPHAFHSVPDSPQTALATESTLPEAFVGQSL